MSLSLGPSVIAASMLYAFCIHLVCARGHRGAVYLRVLSMLYRINSILGVDFLREADDLS